MVICSNHHINNCETCMRSVGTWEKHLKSLDTQKLNYCDKCDECCNRLNSNIRLCCNCIETHKFDRVCLKCRNRHQNYEISQYKPKGKVFFDTKEEMIEYGIVPSNIIELYESISKIKPNTYILGKYISKAGDLYQFEFKNNPIINFEFLTLEEHNTFLKIWKGKDKFNELGELVKVVKIIKQFNSPWEFFKYLNCDKTEEKAYKNIEKKKREYDDFSFLMGFLFTLIYGLTNLYNLLITNDIISDNRPIFSYDLILWFGLIACIFLLISGFILDALYIDLKNKSD